MKWLMATAIVLLGSAEARAQCFYDVNYTRCPPIVHPWETTPHYGRDIPRIPRIGGRINQGSSQDMMNDAKLLDYWLKRSRNR